jgi:hypothetical protein
MQYVLPKKASARCDNHRMGSRISDRRGRHFAIGKIGSSQPIVSGKLEVKDARASIQVR